MPGSKPYVLTWTQQHPLARMTPYRRDQAQTYRLGERIPPSALDDHAPMWEAIEALMDPLDTVQLRVNLQRDFTWLSKTSNCTSNLNGGFRVQVYDIKKRYRFADRSINFANFAGPVNNAGAANSPACFFFREPYRFEIPDSQVLLQVQNFEQAPNTVMLAFYGQVLRFNAPGLTFPGGPRTGWDWADSVKQYWLSQSHPNSRRFR